MTSLRFNKLNLDPMTISNLIDQSVLKHPERNALAFYDQKPMTYAEMGEIIKKTAVSLHTRGIKPGDKAAVIGENSPNWICAYLGIIYAGAIVVPILPDFPAEDILNILQHSESRILFASAKQIAKLDASEIKVPLTVISLNEDEITLNSKAITTYSSFIQSASISKAKEIAKHKIAEDDIATIMYTSGTTGLSKGVQLSHKSLLCVPFAADECVTLSCNDRFLSVLPTSHVFEATLGLFLPIAHGASIYYLGKAPTADVMKEACDIVKPTVLCLVPLIIERVYNKKVKPKLMESAIIKNLIRISFFKKLVYRKAAKAIVEYFGGQLNVIAFGGAPLDGEVEEFLMKGRFPYVFGYGLTEAAGLACGAPADKKKARTCGYPIRYLQVKVTDPDPATGVGEIMVKSPTVMAGYYKNEELTREVISQDGWLKTGDRGTLDKNGYLQIRGRSKAMFLSASGENVYPEIIEEKLRKFPIVQEALARESKGTIEALVYPDPDVLAKKIEGKSETDREQIISEIMENIRVAVNKRLPHFCRIKKCVYQAEPFIKNATNKIKRFLYSSKHDADHSAAN